jgi:glutaminyl-peptide cyclotransferase
MREDEVPNPADEAPVSDPAVKTRAFLSAGTWVFLALASLLILAAVGYVFGGGRAGGRAGLQAGDDPDFAGFPFHAYPGPTADAAGRGRDGAAPATSAAEDEVQQLAVQVLGSFPHDPEAFTQGLVWDAGRLFESTGLEGRSSLREVAPATGVVLRKVDLEPQIFAEGLAMVGDRLLQITWKNEVAFDWEKDSFDKLGDFRYQGEGWGLCLDGDRLVMSDGSDVLTFRDPVTFEVEGQMPVTLHGAPVRALNELECVGDDVYANIWLTDWIYRIDKHSGKVNAKILAEGLLTPEEEAAADVLNGIAHKPETGTFLITGKLWPKLFEVRFTQSEAMIPFAVTPARRGG